ncbi:MULTISPECIES: DUF3105 domain-containing protein [unclassified Nocardioides]|uniref:DUF3105 domain-containing protein n=1 Tax=unclassified Nocardioides TaxID=2615069 RepID=UPI0011683C95|nr:MULTISPECIES: DUF3105 domain-containing protein [unclassified Nocardioides]TQK72320.1 uncharacterized protein DUF3105 [Nocardioides sp. SLBN-35]WGY03472.1 DUF3105 domain-containing protein [Nocardioides sp. QY071]
MAKSSKSEKSERRQVIDDIRRKQKRADKRQGMAIVGVCVAVALVIVGAALYPKVRDMVNDQKWKGKSVAQIGASASVCGDITEKEATGSGEHVPEGQQVDYKDAPPAFGAHWNVAGVAPTPIGDRFYTEDSRPELEQLIHNSEHGYTILWYDTTANDDAAEVAAMRAIAKIMDANDTNQRLKFKVAPWTKADEKEIGKSFPKGQHIAFTHWRVDPDTQKQYGAWQYCSEVSGAALKKFMDKYPFTDAPEPYAY